MDIVTINQIFGLCVISVLISKHWSMLKLALSSQNYVSKLLKGTKIKHQQDLHITNFESELHLLGHASIRADNPSFIVMHTHQ